MFQFSLRKWQIGSMVVVAISCLILLFVGGPHSFSQRSHELTWGLGHILCFAVWSALFLEWRREWSFVRQFVVVIFLTLLLGVGIELIQATLGRNFDLADVLNNLAGSLLVLAFSACGRQSPKRWRLLVQLLAVLMLSVGLFPLGKALFDEYQASTQFPILSDFESSLELDRWQGNSLRSMNRDFVAHGDFSLKVDLNTDRYSGLSLKFLPGDWRAFEMLTFDLYNPSKAALRVTCRIHDRFHADYDNAYTDRFNKTFIIEPGWIQVDLPLKQVSEAPKNRMLDLEQVAGLGIFVMDQKEAKTLYIDHVRLRY